jgi:peptidoglycan-associated lipoprotein
MREDSLAMARRATEEVRAMLMTRINFDFDKSDIRPGDAQILDQKLAILQANPDLRIEIVGHCDERGSDEYNLALGNRRALAAKQYLVSRGIAADRITTRSMGEEQPLVMGSTEEAWAQNRRDEFAVVSGGDMLRRPPGM